ncbi:MAG: PfkB family carbohydrate kinase [Nitrospirota bacterium]
MSILVVGTVALDSVKTPFGKVTEALGGSATYFSLAANIFTKVKLVGVVGADFPNEYVLFLKERGIDLEGLQQIEGKTFRWKGEYRYDLNAAITLETQLNVLEIFSPEIPPQYQDTEFIFLANIDPELQLNVLEQLKSPKLVVADTMNFWIERKKDALLEVLKKIDIAILNDGEARQLTNEPNLINAAKKILSLGPKRVIIKKGEHGSLMVSKSRFAKSRFFSAPAYPLESIFDPTGAGDSFAGGFLGYLASQEKISEQEMKKAIICGTTVASFTVEDFSVNRLMTLTKEEIKKRYLKIKKITRF